MFVFWWLLGLTVSLFVIQIVTDHLPRMLTYFLMGCICSLFSLVLMFPLLWGLIWPSAEQIERVGEMSLITRIVGLIIFGFPVYACPILIPPMIAIGMSVSDRAETAIGREIRRGLRK